jgi:hypothetical protein
MALGPWRGTRLRQTKYNRVDFRLPGETVASSSMVQVGSDFARATESSGIGSAQESCALRHWSLRRPLSGAATRCWTDRRQAMSA